MKLKSLQQLKYSDKLILFVEHIVCVNVITSDKLFGFVVCISLECCALCRILNSYHIHILALFNVQNHFIMPFYLTFTSIFVM